MLRIGVIGYGSRIRTMLQRAGVFEIPYRVVAIGDPRAEEIKGYDDPWLEGCRYFADGREMVDKADELDGIMVGTRCFMHADDACRAAARQVPLFVEKPVAITFEQVKRLAETFEDYRPPVVVSFPLRVTRLAEEVKRLIEADTIGRIDQVVAFNDVPYARGYYSGWYRDHEQTGGLWMQKATHDLDTLNFLIGQAPAKVFAMESRRVYGGHKPADLRCGDCQELRTCPESTFNVFYQQMRGDRVRSRGGLCVFSSAIKHHDSAHALVEYADGLQANYTQNFFARHKAARRGARLYGYKGTIDFDWYQNRIQVFSHRTPTVSTVEYPYIAHHWGGDEELCYDWLLAMQEGRPSRCPMSTGIESALLCLWARQSAATSQLCAVRLP